MVHSYDKLFLDLYNALSTRDDFNVLLDRAGITGADRTQGLFIGKILDDANREHLIGDYAAIDAYFRSSNSDEREQLLDYLFYLVLYIVVEEMLRDKIYSGKFNLDGDKNCMGEPVVGRRVMGRHFNFYRSITLNKRNLETKAYLITRRVSLVWTPLDFTTFRIKHCRQDIKFTLHYGPDVGGEIIRRVEMYWQDVTQTAITSWVAQEYPEMLEEANYE